ncbi:class I SAM-dependent methyltransferase [Saccharothrix syringae]|uniref:class I SAM-dependent methyltransferase n=1 Tax=Saccharothrix syringae TaxID=103733 RepID=UPI000AB566C1|nr:class I SAM-dependent methyltransferase [Saccharothrix syringae]
MPPAPAAIADLGCDTGSLTALLTEAGHEVHGLDLSPRIIEAARAKVPGAKLHQGDAATPPWPPATFDVVLARHVLWALPAPATALQRWRTLFKPNGQLVPVEGHWSTGAGLTAEDCLALAGPGHLRRLTNPALWGREVTDERYLVLAR